MLENISSMESIIDEYRGKKKLKNDLYVKTSSDENIWFEMENIEKTYITYIWCA